METLAGKVALITGGSRGIGAATAQLLARRGAAVVIVYGSAEGPAVTLADQIRHQGGRAAVSGGDLRLAATSDAAVQCALDSFGKLDILVTAAGVSSLAPLSSISEDQYRNIFDINVLGTLLPIRAAAPHLTAPGGRIITLSSRLAQNPFAGAGLYSASKAAVLAMTQSFAKELGPRGITVNAVLPGMIETEMTRDAVAARGASVAAETPLRRIGQPEDVARAIAMLASEDSGWITGQAVRVDGGLT
jgi:3-oxoacyl-[acyl-carrier protein] reductase